MATSHALDLPAYDPAQHVPPARNLFPALTISSSGNAYLSLDIIHQLGLRNRQPGTLVPPPPGSDSWHLDLRPSAGRVICWYADTRPRIRGIKLPPGLVLPGQPLRLCLVPGDPAFPGFYRLLPDAYFTPKQAPPLAA
jgi:hypothetical protein